MEGETLETDGTTSTVMAAVDVIVLHVTRIAMEPVLKPAGVMHTSMVGEVTMVDVHARVPTVAVQPVKKCVPVMLSRLGRVGTLAGATLVTVGAAAQDAHWQVQRHHS